MQNEISGHIPKRRLTGYQLHSTRDVDQAREMTSKVFCKHRLQPRNHKAFDACHNHASLDCCSLNYLDFNSDVEIVPGCMEDFYLFELPLNGSAKVKTGKHELLINPGTAAVVNPDYYTSMHWSADCQMLMLKVDEQAVVQQLAHLLGRPINNRVYFSPELDKREGEQGTLFRLLDFCLSETERTDINSLKNPLFVEMRSMLLSSLLMTLPHNFSDALQVNDKRLAPANVRKAIDYIHDHYQEAVTIKELVQISKASARSLFDCFQRFVGSTPMQYLRKIRLEKAREKLILGDPQCSVTEIAMNCGFSQLGRFSSWYKQVYGESPSETYRNAQRQVYAGSHHTSGH